MVGLVGLVVAQDEAVPVLDARFVPVRVAAVAGDADNHRLEVLVRLLLREAGVLAALRTVAPPLVLAVVEPGWVLVTVVVVPPTNS